MRSCAPSPTLRAPVASAQSLMNTLCQGYAGDLSETQSDVVTRIGTRLDLLQELITDLLDLAAGREGQDYQRQPNFSFAHYVDAIVRAPAPPGGKHAASR